jgi:hypothetical protein
LEIWDEQDSTPVVPQNLVSISVMVEAMFVWWECFVVVGFFAVGLGIEFGDVMEIDKK